VPAQPGPPGYFSSGSPSQGIRPTRVDADWLNTIQEELAYVIEGSGLILSKTDRTQLAQALSRLGRQRLTADLELFVGNAGSDNNTGLTPSTAFASMQHAYEYCRDRLDLNGHQVTVWLLDGAYAPLTASYPVVGPAIKFIGNPNAPGNVIVHNPSGPAITAVFNANIWLESFHVGASSAGSTDYLQSGSGIVASMASNIVVNNIDFGACSVAHMESLSGSNITLPGQGASLSISGPAMACMYAQYASTLTMVDGTITLVGNPAFSLGFAVSEGASSLLAWGMTFAGTASGPQFAVATQGMIFTQRGASAGYFPGSAPGTNDGTGIIQ
jgi:hypothetical protein